MPIPSLPVPCKIRKGTSGTDYYYFDGVYAPTSLGGGVGTALNAIAGDLTVYDLSVANFDALDEYFGNKLLAIAAIIANAVNT